MDITRLMSLDPAVRQAAANRAHYKDAGGVLRCPDEQGNLIYTRFYGTLVEVRCPHFVEVLRYEAPR